MKERRWKSRWLCLLAVLIWLGGAGLCMKSRKAANRTYLILEATVSGAEAEEVFAGERETEEPVGFCFWGEESGQWVRCRETGAQAQVTYLRLAGNLGLVGGEALLWQDGCYLDKQTARHLFGTENCGGQMLTLEGREYRVLGTVETKTATVITAAEATEEGVLNRCVLALEPGKNDTKAEEFRLRWQLQGKNVYYDRMWMLSYDLLALLPAMWLVAGIRKGKRALAGRESADRPWKSRLFGWVAGACLLGLAGGYLQVPADLIPSRWSDFSFWGRWWEAERENLANILATQMGAGCLQMEQDMIKSMIASLTAAVLAAGAERRWDHADTAGGG